MWCYPIWQRKRQQRVFGTLTKLYEAKSSYNMIFLKRRLYILGMVETASMTDRINTLKTLFTQLTTLGHKIEETKRAE